MNKNTFSMISAGFTAIALLAAPGKSHAQSAELKAAIKLTDNEQFDKASSVFRSMLAKDAVNAETWFYFGENLFAAEKIDSAEVLYKKGWETNAKNPLNEIGIAKIQRVKGKMAEAQTSMDHAFALFNEKGVKIKDDLKTRTYTEAAEALLEGTPKNTAKALEYVNKALELEESNVNAHIVKGDVLFAADPLNATPSIEAFKKAIQLEPHSPLPYSKLAYMYYRGGQNLFPKAIEYYTEAIQHDANFAPAYIGRADAYYFSNKSEEAINDSKKYLELNKGNLNAQKRYIGFLIAAKKFDEAAAEITKLEKSIGTQDPILNRLKGYALYEKADYQGAMDALLFFTSKYQKDKITATDYEYLGRAYGKTGNDSLQAYYFEKVLRTDYKNKQGLATEMIGFYKEKKNYKKQAYWYQIKTKLGSKDVNDYYYLGRTAYYAGLYEKSDSAWVEYTKVMGHVPDGFFGDAKALQGIDPKNEKWLAKDAYLTAISKVKLPDEQDKYKKDLEGAYFYLGNYFYLSPEKNVGKAKCYYNKVVALGTGSDVSTQVAKFLESKDLKAATEACE